MSPEEYIREVDKLVDDYDYDDPLIKLYLGFRVGVIAEKHTDKTKEDRAVIDAAFAYCRGYCGYGELLVEIEAHQDYKNGDGLIKEEDFELALYQIWWKSGGYSYASIWMDREGERQIAPTNWISSAPLKGVINKIDSFKILHRKDHAAEENEVLDRREERRKEDI